MIYIVDAVNSLGITGYALRGEPTSSSEFNSMFSKVTSTNSDGITIESNDPADFGTTWDLVKAKMIELQSQYDSQAYARSRKVEYDKLNQDEMRFDDLVNSTTTWHDAIAAIKVAIPKP